MVQPQRWEPVLTAPGGRATPPGDLIVLPESLFSAAAAASASPHHPLHTHVRAALRPYRYDLDLRDARELALQRLSRFCRSGFVSITDFRHDPLRIFAAHECAALVDPSMATKMTVQVCSSCQAC